LAVVEDLGRGGPEGADAAYRLKLLREEAALDRLLALLPGDGDAVTLQVVDALGMIGSPRAVPALNRMLREDEIEYPGKLRAVIISAVRRCSK
jgi:HEAT repeat protein